MISNEQGEAPHRPPPLTVRDHDWQVLAEIIELGGTVRSEDLRMARAASVGRLICSGLLWIPPGRDGIIAVSPHVDAYLAGRAAQQHPGMTNPYDRFYATQHRAWADGHGARIHHPNPDIPCFPKPRTSP